MIDDRPADAEARYTRTAIALHWIIAAAVLAQIPFGWWLETVERGTPARSFYVNLHKSIGVTLAVLIVFRVLWRLTHRPPPAPDWMSAWERIGASLTHWGLYACMLLMPLSGYIASNFSKWGVKYFNVITFPPWGVEDERIYAFFNGLHVLTSYVFVTLIVLHLLGALRHALRRDGVLARMRPGRESRDEREGVGHSNVHRSGTRA